MALDVRSAACSYLRGGKVTVHLAGSAGVTTPKPFWVEATVVGNSATYRVGCSVDDGWWCTCGKPAECAHAAAVQMVTGHDSLARPRLAGTGSG